MKPLFEIESLKMPLIYYTHRTSFFSCAISSHPERFFCDYFNGKHNDFIKKCYDYSLKPYDRKFKEKEFKVHYGTFSKIEKIILVELPLPKPKKDGVNAPYYKMYCIPYLQDEKRIELLDLYAVQPEPGMHDHYMIVKHKYNKEQIPPLIITGSFPVFIDFKDEKSMLQTLYKYIFC